MCAIGTGIDVLPNDLNYVAKFKLARSVDVSRGLYKVNSDNSYVINCGNVHLKVLNVCTSLLEVYLEGKRCVWTEELKVDFQCRCVLLQTHLNILWELL
jgi:hypothetical protein